MVKVMKWSMIITSAIIIAGCMASVPSYMKHSEVPVAKSAPIEDRRIEERPKNPAPPPPHMFPKKEPSTVVPNTDTKKESASKTDKVTSQLYTSSIAFTAPEKANIKEDITIQLLIDPSKELKDLERSLTEAGKKTSAQIRISQIMVATLTAPDFEVQKVTPEEQAVARTDRTEWLWTLTPKSTGRNEIKLSITAVVNLDGKDYKYHIKTYEKIIVIEIKAQQQIAEWLAAYWQWMFTTLILPFGMWIYKRYNKE